MTVSDLFMRVFGTSISSVPGPKNWYLSNSGPSTNVILPSDALRVWAEKLRFSSMCAGEAKVWSIS